ncbi:MAG: DUF3021 domain-containing protein [Flexilinea sp.]|nr:DUF3021 domain-containing protein [Flexilinea sp.]
MENLREKFIRRGITGFLIGLPVGDLIAVIPDLIAARPLRWVSDVLLIRAGSLAGALILQTLFSGVIGMAAIAGMTFYEIESWSMYKSALIHYLLIIGVFIPIALFLGWITPHIGDILFMSGIMGVVYLLIWLFMYWNYRRETEDLNREIKGNKK